MFLADLYQFLRDSSAVSTDEIYPHVFPLEAPEKGITFELIGAERLVEYPGETNDRGASVQLNVWALDFLDAFSLAEELEVALGNFEGELVVGGSDVDLVRVTNEFSGFEPDTGFYRVTYLMTIDYRKP